MRGRNTSAWTCERCGLLLCPGCHATADPACATEHRPAAEAGRAAAAEPAREEEVDQAALLLELTARPQPRTLQWCARSLRTRVQAQLKQALGAAVIATQAAPGTAWEEEMHRWAWLMPSLLLRAPPDSGAQQPGTTAAVTQAVRRRLQLAETAQWGLLLKEAAEEARAAAAEEEARPPQQEPAGEQAAALRRAQAAVTKARAGNIRGGLQVLTGEGVESGTAETVAKLKLLVIEDRAEADEGGELEAQLAAAKAALERRGPPKLHMRGLRRRTRGLRAGAAPGASGWRNSHIQLLAEDPQGAGWLLEWCRLWAAGAPAGEVAVDARSLGPTATPGRQSQAHSIDRGAAQSG